MTRRQANKHGKSLRVKLIAPVDNEDAMVDYFVKAMICLAIDMIKDGIEGEFSQVP